MIRVASFDLIDTEELDAMIWYFPEEEPLSSEFETAGMESTLFLQNIGFMLYLVLLNILIVISHLFLLPCRKACRFSAKVH